MPQANLVLLTLALLVLAGCEAPTPREDPDGIHWGLGLDIQRPFPAPGPFREGTANVTQLTHDLDETFTQMLMDCHVPEAIADMRNRLPDGNLLSLIWTTIDVCEGDVGGQSRALSRQAIENGTELEVYLRLRAEAQSVLERQARLLSGLRPPGSVVEAEVQATLMNMNAYHVLALETGKQALASYNATQNELDYDQSILNSLDVLLREDAFRNFVEEFPWRPGDCTPPNLKELERRLLLDIHLVLNLSFRLEPPSPGNPVNEIHGSVLKGTLPNFLHYSSHGWWPPMLAQVEVISRELGVMRTYESNVLPTREEAQYLLAVHLHANRTLDAEEQMRFFEYQISSDSLPWEEHHEAEARMALALEDMEWGFGMLDCTPVMRPA